MDPLTRLRAIAESAPAKPFESCLPPSVLVYRPFFVEADGSSGPMAGHHRMYVAGGQYRVEYWPDWPAGEPTRVVVIGRDEVFSLDGSPDAAAIPTRRTVWGKLPLKQYFRRGEPGFDGTCLNLIDINANPLLATHHGPHSDQSVHELMGVLASRRDAKWTLGDVRDDLRDGRACTRVEATRANEGVSKWWFDREKNVLLASDQGFENDRYVASQRVEFDFTNIRCPTCTKLTRTHSERGKSQGGMGLALAESKPWREDADWFSSASLFALEKPVPRPSPPAPPAVRPEVYAGAGIAIAVPLLLAAVYLWLGRTRR